MRKLLTEMILNAREIAKRENLHFHFHAFTGWGTSQCPKSFLKAVFLLGLI